MAFNHLLLASGADQSNGALAPTWEEGPHNIEAEQLVLGAILIDNSFFDCVAQNLMPHHFADPLHAKIYELAAKLISADKPANPSLCVHSSRQPSPLRPMYLFLCTLPAYPPLPGAPSQHRCMTMRVKSTSFGDKEWRAVMGRVWPRPRMLYQTN